MTVKDAILTGLNQGMADYVAGLFKVYLTPNEPEADERLAAGLRKAIERYEAAVKIADPEI